MAVGVDEEEEGDEEDADDDDDDNDGDDKDSANLALERVTGPTDTPSSGFFGGRPRFFPPEMDTPDDGTKEVKEDETADTNGDDRTEGRDGKDEGNDEQADADEEDNDTKSQRYVWECHALGLDMSKAFDTINRAKLLDVMSSFLGRDEVHMIQHLLYGTTISVRMCSSTSKAFHTTIGTPQGDSLSPVLFVCYLEAALQECRPRLSQRPITDGGIPPETGYADNITFYSTSKPRLEESLPVISSTLQSWNLNVNEPKTECGHFTSGDSFWRSVRQLDSLMGSAEDIDRRISLASQAYGSMCSLWLRRKHVSERSRLKLYSSLVLPVLLYNCETWGVPQAVFQRLDCFHRRQLRNLVGLLYPDRITNGDLYSRCGSQPLSELVAKQRRSLTGHVLRMSEQSPPCLAMSSYF
ncbi:uncharacterized protein LOC135826742 [Sycon ciliatum]|uniref:uncharacterized protein LOC135826742 n=1 Tax=Sycon ciliatum TaxID=27933 RepID=UPI0031F68AC6